MLFAQVGQHVACLEKSAGDGGTITIEDHRYDRVRCRTKRRGPSQEFVAGKRLVAFVVAAWPMVRISGIPVFESVKTCVLSNKLITVEDAHQLRGEPDRHCFSYQLKWHRVVLVVTGDVPVTVDFAPLV